MWPFSKKKEVPAVPNMGFIGNPVAINAPPQQRQEVVRHLYRIFNMRKALVEANSKARASLSEGIRQRKALLSAANVEVPESKAELVALIQEWEGK